MTPDQYRAKWNLPADYPMVAPNYAAARSQLAKPQYDDETGTVLADDSAARDYAERLIRELKELRMISAKRPRVSSIFAEQATKTPLSQVVRLEPLYLLQEWIPNCHVPF